MGRNDKNIYAIIVVFALLVLAGFYLIFDKIGQLGTNVKNLELTLAIIEKGAKGESPTPTPPETPPSNPPVSGPPQQQPPSLESVSVPTAIIFQASSSPLLQPQVGLTITVDSVGKLSDGTVTVNIKVFNSEAQNYSALEPQNLFELVNVSGENQKVFGVNGQFSSIPPKSAVTGSVTFRISPTQSTTILQVGSGDNLKFYEIDFVKKTYKETEIG